MKDIAIVGGGPAGALCGERLASQGFHVTIFDERLAWEKPCGGGLTHKAIEAYPFLLDGPHPKKIVRTAELISGSGHRARVEMSHPIVIYARKVLNGLLLDRAVAAGCTTVCSRVTSVNTDGAQVRLMAGGEERRSDFVVLAAGARNQLLAGNDGSRRAGSGNDTRLLRADRGRHHQGEIPEGIRGLHVVVSARRSSFRRHLRENGPESDATTARVTSTNSCRKKTSAWTARAFTATCCLRPKRKPSADGASWARTGRMAGDAAACVDPLTGEGLYYALRSGDLLAQALVEGQPQAYPERLRAAFSADLEFAANIARKIFRGNILGGAITTRMVQVLSHSPALRDLIGEVFSGCAGLSQPETPSVGPGRRDIPASSRAAFSVRAYF